MTADVAVYAQNVPGATEAVHAVNAPLYDPPESIHGCDKYSQDHIAGQIRNVDKQLC